MIVHVFATKSNIGDWMSAKGIQHLLAPYQATEAFCDEPFVDETVAKLQTLSTTDLIVIGGGGLFMDYFMPFWERFAEIAARVPFCVWGVGYCDNKRAGSRPSARLLHDILSLSKLSIVRDELSRTYLADCDIPIPVQCPAMAVLEPPRAPGFGVLHADHYDVVGNAVYDVTHAAAQDFARRTGRPYRETDNQIPDGDEGALADRIQRYADSDIVVSSRLHGCIIGLAMGRKVLAISGDRKVDSFMAAAGLSEWVIDIADMSSLHDRLERLPDQRWPEGFVAHVRSENRRVGEMVKAIARALEAGTDVPKRELRVAPSAI
jgi:hypothetical protein